MAPVACRTKYSAIYIAVLLCLAVLRIESSTKESTTTTNKSTEKHEVPSTADAFFAETFEEYTSFGDGKWVKSVHERYASQKVDIRSSPSAVDLFSEDKALVLELPAKHYGLTVPLESSFAFNDEHDEMVIQYEVRLENGMECGGAYIKLLLESDGIETLSDQSPYVIMFGPDICGTSNKVHFIFRHQNPVSKEYEEKHMNSPPTAKSDRLTHLYTLVIRKDNTFEVLIDMESIKTGNLLEDFTPPVNPEEEIDDPSDKKPADWVDEAKIADPAASKPDDWDEDAPMVIPDEDAVMPASWMEDEEKTIPDPSVVKPDDWDDEEDGEFEAPHIPNPKCESAGCGKWVRPTKPNPNYKGKWSAPMIDNPAYKGEWKPQRIKNPNYFVDKEPYKLKPMKAVAIEIWTMSGGIHFDNFWLGYNSDKAKDFALKTWKIKHQLESEKEQENRKKLKDEERDSLLKVGGVLNLLTVYAGDVLQVAKDNVILAISSILVVMITSVILCGGWRPFSSGETVEESEAAPGSEPKSSDEEEEQDEIPKEDEEQEDEEQEEEKPKARQRKRAPKAE